MLASKSGVTEVKGIERERFSCLGGDAATKTVYQCSETDREGETEGRQVELDL